MLCYTSSLEIFDEYLVMVAITFDALKYANRLKAAGAESRIAEAEAEALAEVFELNLKEVATREDLKQMEDRLNEKMDARFLQLEQRMIIKLGGLMVVAIGVVATLVKIL
ncbi:MAG: DUF1640 domain-containing protein [Methylococcaceae bacterium]